MTEEKSYWNFCLRLFLAKVRLSVLGMCITEAVRAQPPPQALRFSHGRGERETSDW